MQNEGHGKTVVVDVRSFFVNPHPLILNLFVLHEDLERLFMTSTEKVVIAHQIYFPDRMPHAKARMNSKIAEEQIGF